MNSVGSKDDGVSVSLWPRDGPAARARPRTARRAPLWADSELPLRKSQTLERGRPPQPKRPASPWCLVVGCVRVSPRPAPCLSCGCSRPHVCPSLRATCLLPVGLRSAARTHGHAADPAPDRAGARGAPEVPVRWCALWKLRRTNPRLPFALVQTSPFTSLFVVLSAMRMGDEAAGHASPKPFFHRLWAWRPCPGSTTDSKQVLASVHLSGPRTGLPAGDGCCVTEPTEDHGDVLIHTGLLSERCLTAWPGEPAVWMTVSRESFWRLV